MTSRPLTYAETVKADPFVRKLDNGVILHINQWGALETMEIWQSVQALKPIWEKVENGKAITHNSMLIFTYVAQSIYRMTKKPRFFINRLFYKRKFFKWANDNVGQILSIWEDLSKSQTCTFFFDRPPAEIANGTGRKVQKDWFAEYCGEYDPKTTSWLFIRHKRELEKAQSIEKYYANKKVNSGTRK